MNTEIGKSKAAFCKVMEILFVAILFAIVEYYFFGFNNIDFSYPISYQGDTVTGLVDIKRLITGQNDTNGWPYFVDTLSYSAVYNMLYRLLVKLSGCFFDNYYLIFNIYLFLIPEFNALIFYCVVRTLDIRKWIAFVGAVLFGFCPYVQFRLPCHMALASIECIPLVILLVFWLFEDSTFNSLNRGFFKQKKTWASLLFAWMIANNGMVYYPFFSCFILVVVAVCIFLRDRKIRRIVPCIITIGEIVFFMIIAFVPTIIGIMKGIGNTATNGVSRNALRATEYGLNLFSLLLSPKEFCSDGIFNKQSYILSWDNENMFAYIGIIAIFGFIMLLLRIFRSDNAINSLSDKNEKRMFILSRINVAILLLSVLDGLGVIVALIVPFISCYNRISPFIVCISILAVLLKLEQMFNGGVKNKVLLTVILFLSFIGIWDIQGCYNYFPNNIGQITKEKVDSDRVFFEKIEDSSEEDSMIFMLPYMRSFENGPIMNITDYDHYKGTLYTNSLRWSYGASVGSKNDQWYYETSILEPQKLVEEIKKQGFSGIYLNLDGYEPESGMLLKDDLCKYSGEENPIVHGNGQIYYIAIKK